MSGGTRAAGTTLLIGAGNRLRGDDGVGPEVVARVGRRTPVATRELSGELGELLAVLDEARAAGREVILVDACLSGAPAGTVHRLERDDPLPPEPAALSSHGMGVAAAIELGRTLGRLPARLRILAVEGRRFAPGRGLSPPVELAAAELASGLVAELADGAGPRV